MNNTDVLQVIKDYAQQKGDEKLKIFCEHALGLEKAMKELNKLDLSLERCKYPFSLEKCMDPFCDVHPEVCITGHTILGTKSQLTRDDIITKSKRPTELGKIKPTKKKRK